MKFDLSDETSVLFAITCDGTGGIYLTNPYGEVLAARKVTGETEEEINASVMSGANSMLAQHARDI